MRGVERLRKIEQTTKPLAKVLPALPVAETVMIRLIRGGAYGLEDYFLKVFRNLGLTEKAHHLLCVLAASQKGQAYPSQLSELIGTSRANITKILAGLEKANYVSRESGKTDARRSLIKITPQGLGAVKEVMPLIAGPIADAFEGLTADEMSVLDGLLRKLIVSFDDASHKADSSF